MSSANSISLFIFIIHKQGRYKKYVAISYEGVVYFMGKFDFKMVICEYVLKWNREEQGTLVELLLACAWETWISWARMSSAMDTSWGKTCGHII